MQKIDSICAINSIPSNIINHISTFLHYRDCAVLGLTCKDLFFQIDYNELLVKFIEDLEQVKLNGLNIRNMEYQNERLCLEAVKQNGLALLYVKKQTPQICYQAVKQKNEAVEFVTRQNILVDNISIPHELCSLIISFMDYMDIARTGLTCKLLYAQTRWKQLKLKYDGEMYCVERCRKYGLILQYIENQTERICIEAVRQNANALKYVKNQTEKICIEAVRQDGYVLEYVKNQTEQICLEAIRQNGYALKYVQNQTEQICLELVRQNGLTLHYVKNQTKQICSEAVEENKHDTQYIR